MKLYQIDPGHFQEWLLGNDVIMYDEYIDGVTQEINEKKLFGANYISLEIDENDLILEYLDEMDEDLIRPWLDEEEDEFAPDTLELQEV